MSDTLSIPTKNDESDRAAAAPHKSVRKHIRGSSILLAGRFLYKGLNCAVQVLLVRFLSQAEYGSLAYALAVMTMMESVAAFGLTRSLSRFLPIYEEQKRYDRMFGAMLFGLGTAVSLGLLMILGTYAGRGFLESHVIDNPLALSLLLLLVFSAPLRGIDQLLLGLFAVFAKPSAIFFRRHILEPVLRLLVVLAVLLAHGSVTQVAIAYLAAGAVGTAVGLALLGQCIVRRGLWTRFSFRAASVPWKEILVFAVPMLSVDLLIVVTQTVDVILLERLADVTAVAAFRAVYPIALMNQLILASFSTLYLPSASRMLAHRDGKGINDLYWTTGVWIAVFSFPIFALTFSIAPTVTVLLFGAKYADAAPVLAWLSLGCYVSAGCGLNALTLNVYGRLRFVILANVFVLLVNVAMAALLIPLYGAVGAAIAACTSLVAQQLIYQWGLARKTDVRFFESRYAPVFLLIAVCASILWAVQQAANPPVYVGVVLAGAASLVVLWSSRQVLNANDVFPELLRIPLLRRFLAR